MEKNWTSPLQGSGGNRVRRLTACCRVEPQVEDGRGVYRTSTDMAYQKYSQVALGIDLPKHKLRRGDVATILETHRGRPGQEPGYSLEVFNAVGETITVLTLRESQIEPLTNGEVLHVRRLELVPA